MGPLQSLEGASPARRGRGTMGDLGAAVAAPSRGRRATRAGRRPLRAGRPKPELAGPGMDTTARVPPKLMQRVRNFNAMH
jgi:hypothetical protein